MTLQERLDKLGLLTLLEAESIVECGGSRLRMAVSNGEIASGRLGRWVLVSKDEVLAWDEARLSRVLDGRTPQFKAEALELVKNADLGDLDPRRREAVERRFGLNGYVVHTLDQVGEALDGLSRERTRQIINGVVKRLRRDKEGSA